MVDPTVTLTVCGIRVDVVVVVLRKLTTPQGLLSDTQFQVPLHRHIE